MSSRGFRRGFLVEGHRASSTNASLSVPSSRDEQSQQSLRHRFSHQRVGHLHDPSSREEGAGEGREELSETRSLERKANVQGREDYERPKSPAPLSQDVGENEGREDKSFNLPGEAMLPATEQLQVVLASTNHEKHEKSNRLHELSTPSPQQVLSQPRPPDRSKWNCPVCLSWFKDPVMMKCQHSFCRACIHKYIERHNHAQQQQLERLRLLSQAEARMEDNSQKQKLTCPLCRAVFQVEELVESQSILLDMTTCRLKCQQEGCTLEMNAIQYMTHQDECLNASVPCCHASYGCEFQGKRMHQRKHLENCAYESIKNFFPKVYDKIEHVHELAHKLEHQLNHQIAAFARQDAMLRGLRRLTPENPAHYLTLLHSIYFQLSYHTDCDRWIESFPMHIFLSVLHLGPVFLACMTMFSTHSVMVSSLTCRLHDSICFTYPVVFRIFALLALLSAILLMEGWKKEWRVPFLGRAVYVIVLWVVLTSITLENLWLMFTSHFLVMGLEGNVHATKFHAVFPMTFVIAVSYQIIMSKTHIIASLLLWFFLVLCFSDIVDEFKVTPDGLQEKVRCLLGVSSDYRLSIVLKLYDTTVKSIPKRLKVVIYGALSIEYMAIAWWPNKSFNLDLVGDTFIFLLIVATYFHVQDLFQLIMARSLRDASTFYTQRSNQTGEVRTVIIPNKTILILQRTIYLIGLLGSLTLFLSAMGVPNVLHKLETTRV